MNLDESEDSGASLYDDDHHVNFGLHKDHEEEARDKLASTALSQTNAVLLLRSILLFVLICCAIVVSVAVFVYLRNFENDDFENGFHASANQIVQNVGVDLVSVMAIADGFGVLRINLAKALNQSFPYTTLPSYSSQAIHFLALSRALHMQEALWVNATEKEQWEAYAATHNDWIDEAWALQSQTDLGVVTHREDKPATIVFDDPALEFSNDRYLVTWQTFPVGVGNTLVPLYNHHILGDPGPSTSIRPALESRQIVFSEFHALRPRPGDPVDVGPRFFVAMPLLDRGDDVDFSQVPLAEREPLGVLFFVLGMDDLMRDILPESEMGIFVVANNCEQVFTYELNGGRETYLGDADFHDVRYDHMAVSYDFWQLLELGKVHGPTYRGLPLNRDVCPTTLTIYPSARTESNYTSSQPVLFSTLAGVIFVFTSCLFLFYDTLVERRQRTVMTSAAKSSAIVCSLFPSQVRDRLFQEEKEERKPSESKKGVLKRFAATPLVVGDDDSVSVLGDKAGSSPIADLYPEATIMFADIAGFTAWSSIREPTQVFTLLESIYNRFDRLAKKRAVFKVETIGDCYVAVTGLPEPRKDHALAMARFTRDCRDAMIHVTNTLSLTLGPDTSELQLRIGLHSGPVTAGVLRGDRARFQLFGDTVNTASRMESNGKPGRIHVSQATAEQLVSHGKGHWVSKRETMIEAKGKGKMQTYWVDPRYGGGNSSHNSPGNTSFSETMSECGGDSSTLRVTGKNSRLVAWNAETLCNILREIIATRGDVALESFSPPVTTENEIILHERTNEIMFQPTLSSQKDSMVVVLDVAVADQVRDLVVAVAALHYEQPYHSFEHASHVALSLIAMLHQMSNVEEGDGTPQNSVSRFASNPLVKFACIFAALIFNMDHPGLPNQQLVETKTANATRFHGRSINEQNAFQQGWNLLMDIKYKELREILLASEREWSLFRQVVVNCVLATDMSDREFNADLSKRWFQMHGLESATNEPSENQRATIAMEIIMQAASVAHTMQHWHIYRKWTERRFCEARNAFVDGRSELDPSRDWYSTELSFLDSVVVPLAEKLDQLDESGREYLSYSKKNRDEWDQTGVAVVVELIAYSGGQELLNEMTTISAADVLSITP